jgi:hypothetical protein
MIYSIIISKIVVTLISLGGALATVLADWVAQFKTIHLFYAYRATRAIVRHLQWSR